MASGALGKYKTNGKSKKRKWNEKSNIYDQFSFRMYAQFYASVESKKRIQNRKSM